MERYRNLQIAFREQLRARPAHPECQGRRQVQPVAMLQGENQRTCRIVVAQGRARPVEERRRLDAGGAKRARSRIELEGVATAGAARRCKKRHASPARDAERARSADRDSAMEATRRQQEIEQAAEKSAQAGACSEDRHARDCPPPAVAEQGAPCDIERMPDPGSPIRVFDAQAVRRHRLRAAARARAEFLFDEGAERLADRLADIQRRFPRALELGSRNGLLARRLRGRGGIEWLVATDIAAALVGHAPRPRAVAEAEALPFAAGSFDLALSNLALHWTNDLPGALLQLRHVLRPDGLLLASLLAGETLYELQQALIAGESEVAGGVSARVSPFADSRDLAGLLQRAGFALPVVDSDRIETTYADAFALMRDLRDMGETNAVVLRRRSFTPRAVLARAAAIYQSRFAGSDGRIRATFEIVTLTAWAPHESQPHALKPGSAAARLAEALGTSEHQAGDKARP